MGEPARSFGMPVPSGLPKPILDRLAHIRYAQAFDIFLRSVDVATARWLNTGWKSISRMSSSARQS
jgi:hypothetical protein